MGKRWSNPGLVRFSIDISPYIGKSAPWLAVGVLCALIAGFCNILQTILFKELIDWAVSGGGAGLSGLILRAALITVVWVGVKFLWSFSNGSFRALAVRDLNAAFAAKAETARAELLEGRHSGETMSRYANDVRTLEGFFSGQLTLLVYFWFLFFGSLAYMLFFNWKLALACQILTPLTFILNRKFGSPLSAMGSSLGEALAKANSTAQDSIRGMAVLKSFTLEKLKTAEFEAAVGGITEKGRILDKRRSQMIPLFVLGRQAPTVLCAVLGCWLVIQGELSVGELATFSMLMGYVVGPAFDLPRIISDFKAARGSGVRVLEFLRLPEERKDGEDLPAAGETAVAFEEVRFAYGEGEEVLRGLSFEAGKGKTIALVGRSGSGKTTSLSLICGFRSPQAGHVRLFGKNLEEWSLRAARSRISIVTQDPFLLPDTIAANIRCGRPDASDAEVEGAARAANAHDFIMATKDGYESLVGERGAKLSGGERQRISLARAILKDAELLLLDEPTSALDYRSEALVREAIGRMRENRTAIIVAHRLSTVKDADLILVMDSGRIVERGRHEELLDSGGLYSRLYREKFFVAGEETRAP